MRVVDLDDDAHVFCGEDGEYQKWNIDTAVPTINVIPIAFIKENVVANAILADIYADEKPALSIMYNNRAVAYKHLIELWQEKVV